ncbi:MAG: hypothetical protein U0821_04960 [Chloroflexota bacterium]
MSPILTWGVGIGLAIAAVDTVTFYLTTRVLSGTDFAAYAQLFDELANVLLYTVIGLRVGWAADLVRAAAEGGVIAGALVGILAWLVASVVFPPEGLTLGSRDMVGMLAYNVAMGGILAMIGGYVATRAARRAGAS